MSHDLLEGQVAIVTGGGKGSGRAVALELAARKASVLITGRDERALGEAVGEMANAGGRARHLVGDVREPEAAARAVARAKELWGGIHIVVANAGVAGTPPLSDPAAASPGPPHLGANHPRAHHPLAAAGGP